MVALALAFCAIRLPDRMGMVDRCGLCRRRNPSGQPGGFAAGITRRGIAAHGSNARGSARMNRPAPVVSAVGLTKTYRRGREEIRALDNVAFEIGRAEFVAITGPSGAGKTTLLNLVGCMDA